MILAMLAGCNTSIPEESTPVEVKPISFAVFARTGADPANIGIQALLDSLNGRDIDFAVDLGDIVPSQSSSPIDSLWSQPALISGIGYPVYPVAGTFDVSTPERNSIYSEKLGPQWYEYNRNGVNFVVIHVEDETYRTGFGARARISAEQLAWIEHVMSNTNPDETTVVFMHRPVWETDSSLWQGQLLPLLQSGGVDLILTASDYGLKDWGNVSGIRAISVGSSSSDHRPVSAVPHVLMVSVDDAGFSFSTYIAGTGLRSGVPYAAEYYAAVDQFRRTITLPVLRAEPSWDIGQSVEMRFENTFDMPLECAMDFTVYEDTSWRIEPDSFQFVLEPDDVRTVTVRFDATAPELGPVPDYVGRISHDGTLVCSTSGSLTVDIPRQRTGDVVPISMSAVDIVPYNYDGATLRIPIEIDSPDICGRLIIYQDNGENESRIIHVSPLINFRTGISEFSWDGTDMSGTPVTDGPLMYRIVAYNKEAPATLVGIGPPDRFGTVLLDRTATELRMYTHTDSSIVSYPVGTSRDLRAETQYSFAPLLHGARIQGFAIGADDRYYTLTDQGIVAIVIRRNHPELLNTFGHDGYRTLAEFNTAHFGGIAYHDGRLYLGIGGDYSDRGPAIAVLRADTGTLLEMLPLADYYGRQSAPPGITVNESGIYVSHPVADEVIHLSYAGELLWRNHASNGVLGTGSDEESFSYHPGTDQYGFTYVNTPGYSARCGVLGPDGRGLFRVILTQLPGLRVGDVVPSINGDSTDGLYFVTRGADRPYVFHVPYTIRAGAIIDERSLSARDDNIE